MATVTFPPSIGGDGSTVDDTTGPNGLDGGGHRYRFIPALTNIVNIAAFVVALCTSAINAPGTSATSTSSMTIGTGAQSFTLAQTGKAFAIGQTVVIASTANALNQMTGVITAFNSGTGAITVNVSSVLGSGTVSAWTMALAATSGVSTARTISAAGLATGGGNLSADRTITVTAATNTDAWTGTSTTTVMTPAVLCSMYAPVSVSYASSLTLDCNTGINWTVGALTGNLTLNNLSNLQPGDSGTIRLVQDGTGSRTIAYGSYWKASNGAQPLTTTANAVDVIVYFVRDATTIEYSIMRNVS